MRSNKYSGIIQDFGSIANCINTLGLKNFNKANFQNLNLNDIDFKKAFINYANFKNAILKNINFKDAFLSKANFENAILKQIDFEGTFLDDANFENAIFKNINFLKAALLSASFNNAIFLSVSFKNANLNLTYFKNANLKDVIFDFSELYLADFENAILKQTSFISIINFNIKNKIIISISGIGFEKKQITYNVTDNEIHYNNFYGTLKEFINLIKNTFSIEEIYYEEYRKVINYFLSWEKRRL